MSGNNNDFNGALLRFMAPIEKFRGDENVDKATDWLQSIDMLRTVSKMDDSSTIMIAASNLTQKARSWYNSVSDSLTSWHQFETRFKKKYMEKGVAEAWVKIKEIKQGDNQGIADFIEELNALFRIVNLTDGESKKSFFIASVNSAIAYELERSRYIHNEYDKVLEEAIEIEKLQKRYKGGEYRRSVRFNQETAQDDSNSITTNTYTTNDSASITTANNSIDRMSTDTLSELVNTLKELKISVVELQQGNNNSRPQRQYNSNNFSRPPYGERRPLVCFKCNREGHPQRLCPTLSNNNNSNEGQMGNNNNRYNGGNTNANNNNSSDMSGKGVGHQ